MGIATDTAENLTFSPSPKLGPILTSFGLGLAIFLFIAGKISFWEPGGIEILPSGSYGVGLGLLIASIGYWLSRKANVDRLFDPIGFSFVCVALFFSDWLCRGYNMLQGPTIRGEILALTVISFVIVSTKSFSVLRVVAILAPLLFFWCFLDASRGQLLLSDDHAANFYRLWLLNENFPNVPHYYPLWNTGLEARDYFPSGIFNLFFLWFPIIKALDLRSTYNIIIGVTVFVGSPLCVYLATRILGLKQPIGEIAALLASASTLIWFRWALKYGSMGFVTSMVFFPLTFALCVKIISRDQEISFKEALLFILSTTMTVLWSLGAVIFAPIYIAGLLSIARLIKKRFIKFTLVALLCLNLPWIVTFVSVSNVAKFVQLDRHNAIHNRNEGFDISELERDLNDPWSGKMEVLGVKGVQREVSLRSALRTLRESMHSTNPLLIIFALPGILLLRRRSEKLLYGLSALWLMFLGGFLSAVKPQLELDRMFVALGFLLCVPAAICISSLFDGPLEKMRSLCAAFVCGVLLSGVFAVTAIAQNRSFVQYYFDDGSFAGISQAISKYSGSGRVVFLGFVLHELSHSHIAPLTLLTGKPMVASNPFHQIWWYSELVPQAYLDRGDPGIDQFIALKNGTSIIAHEPKWITYLDRRADRFAPVWGDGKFKMYQVIGAKGDYFLEGQGELLSQSSSEVKLKLASSSALIKFQYFPFLKSSACEIGGRKLDGDITFIELKNCPIGSEVTIKMKSVSERLF